MRLLPTLIAKIKALLRKSAVSQLFGLVVAPVRLSLLRMAENGGITTRHRGIRRCRASGFGRGSQAKGNISEGRIGRKLPKSFAPSLGLMSPIGGTRPKTPRPT